MASISPTTVSCSKDRKYSCYLQFVVTSITQTDGSTNQTTINWELRARKGTSNPYLNLRHLEVGGKTLVNKNDTRVSGWKDNQVVNSGSTTFNNNADGSLSLSVFIKQIFWWGYSNTDDNLKGRYNDPTYYETGSGTLTCSTIPRHPVCSLSSVSSTLNTISFTIANSRSGTTLEYYQIAQVSDGTVVAEAYCNGTFTVTIGGLTPGTNYSGKYKVRGWNSVGYGDWLTLTNANIKTVSLPTVSATSNISIDSESTIQLSSLTHLTSYRLEVFIWKNDAWFKIGERKDITVNNYKFKLTDTEKSTVLNNFNGTTSPYIAFDTYVKSNNTEYLIYDTSGKYISIYYTMPNTSNYQPIFTVDNVINVKDILNTAITGNASKFIKNHNRLQATIKPMTPQFGATGNYYVIACGDKTKQVAYSSANQNVTLDNINATTLTVNATDSRNNVTQISKNITLVEYAKPTINKCNITRENGIGEYVLLEASGRYTNWTGLAVANAISKVEYRWKLSTDPDSKYSSWIDAGVVSNSNGSWSITEPLETVFNNTLKYYIQIRVTDKLETVNGTPYPLSTADVFIWKDLANKRLGIGKKPDYTLDINGDINFTGKIYRNGQEIIINTDGWFG